MKKEDLQPDLVSAGKAIKKAMTEYKKFKNSCKRDNIILVFDMTQPSYKKRLHIVSLDDGSILKSHHCAHGEKSSNPRNLAYCVNFSNTVGSHMSSLGAMVTGDTYRGKHGHSLRLDGLEKGINDNVRRRSIVIHSAVYVSDAYILQQGRAGQSHGCPAVDPAISNELIQNTRDGTFFYAYYK